MKHIYIDPGTGSMLFTIFIGIVSTVLFFGRRLLLKLQFLLQGGRLKDREHLRSSFVIFSDHKRYWNVFEPVCDEFERRGIALTYLTASPDDPALSASYTHVKARFIGEGNAAFARMNVLSADIVLSTTPGLDVYQWKRSRDVSFYVHIPHAANDPVMYRMFGLDYYDAVMISGEYQCRQIRELEEKRSLPAKEMPLIGLTYMDAMLERLSARPPAGEEKHKRITVLLAPSWGENGMLSRFGPPLIEALLQAKVHLIIRPHPQSLITEREMTDALMRRFPEGEGLEWNRDNDNFDVLSRSDILISDFSGVIFDFSLVFDRPVLYTETPYDRGPFDCWWNEREPLWTFETLPRIGRALSEADLPRIGALIADCLADEALAAGRKRARLETWAFPGEAAIRCVDYLVSIRERVTDKTMQPISLCEKTGVIEQK